jgi:hypothetical protein
VTRHGCERGELFEGSMASRGARPALAPARIADHPRVACGRDPRGAGFSETRRTPRPAAGCNKPANLRAEKAVEVVRNHADGTRQDGWCRRPDASLGATRSSAGVDARGHVGGGAASNEPQERQGLDARSALRRRVHSIARGPATVRTLLENALAGATSSGAGKRSRSADDGWFAIPKRRPGAVLEGPGPVTVEGRGGRREEPTDLLTEIHPIGVDQADAARRVATRGSRRSRRRHRSAPLRRPRRPSLSRSCPDLFASSL